MSPEEKMILKEELDKLPMSSCGAGETAIIEPESLRELLAHIIDAIPADEV